MIVVMMPAASAVAYPVAVSPVGEGSNTTGISV